VHLGATSARVTVAATPQLAGGEAFEGTAAAGGPAPSEISFPLAPPLPAPHGGIALGAGSRCSPDAVGAVLALAHATLSTLALRAELRQRRAELMRAGRLASIGTLAASLAHEIRNPLVSIKTFLQLLPERQGDPEFMGEFLALTEAEVNRINNMLDRLLDFARPATPRFIEGDLNAVGRRAVALAQSDLKDRDVDVVTEFDPALPAVRLDPDQMHQVVLNLLLNAAQASSRGQCVRLVTVRENGGVAMSVIDAGPGVPEELKGKLFSPFVTTKRGGSGLGLAVSRQIVEEHGGNLSFESRPGETAFTVRLPYSI